MCYADIFSYPLTHAEMRNYQIYSPHAPSVARIRLETKDGYYFLPGREKIVHTRLERVSCFEKKIAKATKITYMLSQFSCIQMIAVTGALALKNADREDDIDLLIVTRAGRVWIGRLLTIILLDSLGVRRRPHDIHVADMICVNMFVDEDHMAVPHTERDIFSAHEVVQVLPLWSRGDTSARFFKANTWVNAYMPYALDPERTCSSVSTASLTPVEWIAVRSVQILAVVINFNFFEYGARGLQRWYMNGKRTHEVLKSGYLRFHPHDARRWILKSYRKRLRKIGLE